jgi:UPF0755 protein
MENFESHQSVPSSRAQFSKYLKYGLLGVAILGSFFVARHYYLKINPKIYITPSTRVTLREGLTNAEVADILARSNLPNFNKAIFFAQTSRMQGYLFPDTYRFNTGSTAEDIIGIMHMNFNKKIAKIISDIDSSGRSLSDAITMASIVEGEARGKSDAPTIAGILWKRISLGIPLQVDVAPETYKEKGLPKGPISNPGLVSILAAVHPVDSRYLYYLHDKTGAVHYAENYAIHKKNIAQYLK